MAGAGRGYCGYASPPGGGARRGGAAAAAGSSPRRGGTTVGDFALTRISKDLQKTADYTVSEAFTVDTRDHEDHTFCGMMFDLKAQDVLPIEFVEVQALWVRGDLGPVTVWTTPDTHRGKEEDRTRWRQIYSKEHPSSRETLVQLRLDSPVVLRPGHQVGLYVHTALPGDDGLVYDDMRDDVTYEDRFVSVFPGTAHLSCTPFGKRNPWGWGGAWRRGRAFVGRVTYGARYTLWTPVVHARFPPVFRRTCRALLYARWYWARQCEEDEETIPLEWILMVLNFCRWDIGGTGSPSAAARQPPAAVLMRGFIPASARAVRMLCERVGVLSFVRSIDVRPGGVIRVLFAQRGVARRLVDEFGEGAQFGDADITLELEDVDDEGDGARPRTPPGRWSDADDSSMDSNASSGASDVVEERADDSDDGGADGVVGWTSSWAASAVQAAIPDWAFGDFGAGGAPLSPLPAASPGPSPRRARRRSGGSADASPRRRRRQQEGEEEEGKDGDGDEMEQDGV